VLALQLNSWEGQLCYQILEFLLQHELLVPVTYEGGNLQKSTAASAFLFEEMGS